MGAEETEIANFYKHELSGAIYRGCFQLITIKKSFKIGNRAGGGAGVATKNTNEHKEEDALIADEQLKNQFKYKNTDIVRRKALDNQHTIQKMSAINNSNRTRREPRSRASEEPKFPIFAVDKVRTRFERERIEILEIMAYANGVRLYKARQGELQLVVKTAELEKMSPADKYFQNRDYHFRFILRHKRLMRTFHLAIFHNVIYTIMEAAAKSSLDEILANYGPMSENYSVLIFYEVCKALEYMHRKNIAHRNIKTDNILFTNKNIPKLTDFKYCVEYDGSELLSSYVGNAQYLAPEVLMEQPYNPFPSDIWALGVCFFMMLNDAPPFKACGNNRMLIDEQINRRIRFRKVVEKDLSEKCRELVGKILEPIVDARLTIRKLKVEYYINLIVKGFVDEEKARRGIKPMPDLDTEMKMTSDMGTWFDLTSVATQFRTNNEA